MVDLSSAQGRYYILTSPVATPGNCGVCGYSGNDRRYLDPRLDFDFYGSLIFCEDCVASMSVLFGHLTPDLVRDLESRVEASETELVKLRAAVAAMEDLSVAFGSLGLGTSSDVYRGSSLADRDAIAADQIAPDDVIGEGSGDSEADLSDLLEGPDDVRDDSADDPFGFNL